MLHRNSCKRHFFSLLHPFWLVICLPTAIRGQPLSNRDFGQANILHYCPDNGQTTGLVVIAFITLRCLCTTHRWRAVAGKRAEMAASKPSYPSVTSRSISVAPRVRRSWEQTTPSLLSCAHARMASTSLLPSRSTPSAVKMIVVSALAPCRTEKCTPSRYTTR